MHIPIRVPQVKGVIMETPMSTEKLLFFNEDQVRAVLSYDDLIPGDSDSVRWELSAGRVVQPLRTVMSVAEHNRWFAVIACGVRGRDGRQVGNVSIGGTASLSGSIITWRMIELFRSDTESAAGGDGRAADHGDADGGGVGGGGGLPRSTRRKGVGDPGQRGAGAVARAGAHAGEVV